MAKSFVSTAQLKMNMKTNKLPKLMTVCAAAALAFTCSSAAFAQYIWLNEKGVKQYSDMPPPSEVPKNRILKQPGSGYSAAKPSESDSTSQKPAAEEKTPMTLAEKNADFQKRKIEQAENDKKAAEQRQRAADKAKSCDQARDYQRTLDSGMRVSRTGKDGERQFLNDEQRAREARENKRLIDEACK
jgi:hypothetical protein